MGEKREVDLRHIIDLIKDSIKRKDLLIVGRIEIKELMQLII